MRGLFFLPIAGIGLFVFFIPILIGAFVYYDAPKYNMDRLLWILISTIVPGCVGFIIYLIMSRTNGSSPSYAHTKSCPACGKRVEKEYSTCSYCGSRLEKYCPNCGKKVEVDWLVCPYCSNNLKNP